MLKKWIAVFLAVLCALPMSAFAARMDVDKTPDLNRPRKTPEKILFSLENNEYRFAMLDYGEDGFYIITTKGLGRLQYDPAGSAKFDPNKEGSIAHRLNNEYLTQGINGSILPKQVIDHLVLRDWPIEAGVANSDFPEDYTARCKVALMSMTEWKQYQYDFGMYDDESWWGWYLRTSWAADLRSTAADVMAVSGENAAGPIVINVPAPTACGVRPVFYLDRDFFKTVRLNLTTTGATVKKWLRTVYTEQELSGIYSTEEVQEIVNAEVPPEAYDVWSIGYRNVGDVMTGYYKYKQADNIPENGTTVRWVRSDTPDGVYSEIPGTQGKFTYELQPADANKYVCFEVTPATAKTIGKAYRSSVIEGGTVGAAAKPIVTKSNFFGTPAVGKQIGVQYTYYDANRELEEGTTFQWQRSENGGFVNIPGATARLYTPTEADAGKEIRLCIVPQNRGRYRLAPPYNKGTHAIGDKYYTATVNVVAEPVAEDVKVNRTTLAMSTSVSENDVLSLTLKKQNNQFVNGVMKGNYLYHDLLGIAEENSVYSWEISRDGGKTYLPMAETIDYVVRDGDAGNYIRFGVAPRNAEGTVGAMTYSEPMLIEETDTQTSGAVDSAQFTFAGKKQVTLSAKGLENAYAISFDLTSGAKIQSITGNEYQVYQSGTKPIKCILTKRGAVAANRNQTDLVTIEFDSVYSGTLTISNLRVAGMNGEKVISYEKLPAMLELK